jgi:tetratricopeptide (TPR) repeat protein
MLNDEFAKLKKNQGGLLAFNSFISTSTDQLLSLGFAIGTLDNPSLKAVLFEIEIINGEQASNPFASLNGLSYFESENEILFSMHTIFRIGEILQLENGVWHVKLRLTSDDDMELRRLLMMMRRDVEGSTGLHRLGQLTAKMGEWNKSMEIYKMLVETTNDNDKVMLASLHHQLGVIYYNKGDFDNALIHYQYSLDNSLTFLPHDAYRLGPTYTNIGLVLCKQGDLDRGIGHYQRALEIEMKAVQPNQEQIAIICNNMGSALQDQGRLTEALDKYEQALQINLNILPETHLSLAIRYNNIGMGYYDQKDYLKALFNFQKCLTSEQRSLPSTHPSLIRTNVNLASTLEKLNRYEEALEHAEQAVEVARHCSHPKLKIYENYLDECRTRV